jgi:nitroreductase
MTSTLNADTLLLDADAQALLFRDARTIAAFTDEPVDDEVLRTVYDLVQWAPTSMNCNPLRVLAIRGDEPKARLLPHMADGNKDKTAAAPLVLVLAADHDFTAHMGTLFPFVDAEAVFADPAMKAATAEYNAALQAAYLILGLRAAGLATGPMAGFDRAGVTAEFFADGSTHASLVMLVGRQSGEPEFPRLPRLSYDQVVTSL